MRDISLGYLISGRQLAGPTGQPDLEGTPQQRRAALVPTLPHTPVLYPSSITPSFAFRFSGWICSFEPA